MIPKDIFNIEQTTLNSSITTTKDKLINYRKHLYNELIQELKKSFPNKKQLINDYKIKTSEIDNILKNKKFTILKIEQSFPILKNRK